MTHAASLQTSFESKPARPPSVTLAFRAIVAALLAGVAETVVHVARTLADGDGMGELVPGLLMRTFIYLLVLTVAYRMADGSRWARAALVGGLGILGLASLVIEPLGAITSADGPGDLFADWTPTSWVICLFRVLHVIAVLIAVPAMLRAGNYFRRS
ncbi:hypothetical protein AB0N05_01190 [Nocardia sp. NPDC051030]|uniref:hypothetical protein n=1 Tax=Nocardia sp. NPDC051030 TaxID=3155162 RepID=UPI003438F360